MENLIFYRGNSLVRVQDKIMATRKHYLIAKRKYRRIKPTKNQMRIVKSITLKALLLLAFILMAYGALASTNTFSIIVNTIEKEKVIFVQEETNDTIAERICEQAGITTQPCWQDLKAIRTKESSGGVNMIGDSGKSKGWYHIQIKLHGVSEECALDFQCSTKWTVANLIKNGYLKNRRYAIKRHNGNGIMADKYANLIITLSKTYDY